MKNLIRLLPAVLLVFCALLSQAQTKRALLIGIDVYQPANPAEAQKTRAGWTNLDGCANDAASIREIIKSRFGFDDGNIAELYDQDAKREKIIAAIEKLIADSRKGDVVFIYYAGHGSQMYNSMSAEVAGDKQDETIVPADMLDIRDKELAKLFNRLIDKGVILTLIFDSCHSGSIARGSSAPEISKTRHMAGSAVDAKDPSDPPKPEDRGALIFSAAQPEQLAKEARDDHGTPHGAFTLALIKALNTSAANEPAEVIFLRAKSIMQANGSTQEPVLGANEARRKQGLFGQDLSAVAGKTLVAVLKNNGTDNIELQGGWAIGLNPNCELKKSGSGGEVLRITEVLGMAKCKTQIISGDAGNIKPGDIFELTSWASSTAPNLRVWFPENDFTYEKMLKIIKEISGMLNSKSYKWVSDPTETPAQYTVQYYQGTWKVSGPGGKLHDLGSELDEDVLMKKIPKNATVFLQFPPPKELISQLLLGKGTENSAVEITGDPLRADYILTGKLNDMLLEFAWLRPGITRDENASLSTLPVRTDWFTVKKPEDFPETGKSLTEYATRLGKVNAWLNFSSPPDDGSYPFRLALKNRETGAFVNSGEVYGGEKYNLVLTTSIEELKKWTGKSRYVYVFTIDVSGKTQQIFPSQNTGNEGNKLPNKAFDFEEEIALGQVSFSIGPPYGMDSYFLITSDEAINNFRAFNSDGVVTRSAGAGGPLDALFGNVGAATRGITSDPVPANWSFQRIAITSKERK